MKRVLITGAGIAGPTLAFWLKRFGFMPTVIEKATEIRMGGQTVDVRGAGRVVVDRMGLKQKIVANVTHEKGIKFVDSKNRAKVVFGQDSFGGEGLVSEIEILRPELAKIVYGATADEVEYIFGDSVSAVSQDADRVSVTFASGKTREFELLISAEGIWSKTRELVFPGEAKVKSLNQYMAYFTIPYAKQDDRWARWFSAPGARTLMLRPDNLGTTRAYMSFRSRTRGYGRLAVEDQKKLLRKKFGGVGWESGRMLSGMNTADDFIFEDIGQIKMSGWSKGRVALVGDAAYCASPISGMGTSLAFVGAYVLAGELSRNADHTEAFRAYERVMRPYVTMAQKIFPGSTHIASPRTRLGIKASYALLGLASRPGLRKWFSRISPPAKEIELPVY